MDGQPTDQPSKNALQSLAGRLPLIYESHGYETGYKQALRDVVQLLPAITDLFVKSQTSQSEVIRDWVYQYERLLEAKIDELGREEGFVEGGLGI